MTNRYTFFKAPLQSSSAAVCTGGVHPSRSPFKSSPRSLDALMTIRTECGDEIEESMIHCASANAQRQRADDSHFEPR